MSDAAFPSRVESLVRDCLQTVDPDSVVVGFSGGVDSTALLIASVRVAARAYPAMKVRALHVNHGLHEAAGHWQAHCASISARLGVACISECVDVSAAGNLEANARAARYRVFESVMTSGSLLLLGHHQHDQTETVLYRLFEGRGLLPMRQQGSLGEGSFARPLLSLAPEALQAYVHSQGFTWIEDPSNEDTLYVRNFLRREILPGLSRRWARLHDSVSRVVAAQASAHAALMHELAQLPDEVPLARLPGGETRVAWLRAYLSIRGVHSVTDKALLEFVYQAEAADRAELSCGEQGMLYVYRGRLYFTPPLPPFTEQADVDCFIEPGGEVELTGGTLTLAEAGAGEVLAFPCGAPLRIAFRTGGERMRPAGTQASKTLKQLFNEAGIPPWRRPHYPCCMPVTNWCVCRISPSPRPAAAQKQRVCACAWRAGRN